MTPAREIRIDSLIVSGRSAADGRAFAETFAAEVARADLESARAFDHVEVAVHDSDPDRAGRYAGRDVKGLIER